jgi:hypothetical protein
MPEAWEPTPADVKAHIAQRLNGAAFSATTRPTFAEVEGLIDDIVAEILVAIDAPIVEEAHQNLAKAAAEVGTAATVERILFPEQSNRDGSAYDELRSEFLRLLGQLKFGVTGVEGDEAALSGRFSHSFPTPEPSRPATDDRYVPISTVMF